MLLRPPRPTLFPSRRSSDLIADRIRTNIGLSFTTVKGNSWVNEARLGYNRFNQPQIPVNNGPPAIVPLQGFIKSFVRSEEHTSELQSHVNLVCRLLLEKKNN